MNKCLPYSPLREDYARRIDDLRKIDNDRKRRLNRAGNLSNKKRNKKGILKGMATNINVVDWYEDI